MSGYRTEDSSESHPVPTLQFGQRKADQGWSTYPTRALGRRLALLEAAAGVARIMHTKFASERQTSSNIFV
jgi:hypothetical protein